MNKYDSSWPCKPRGQKPLSWAMNSRIRESNNMVNKKVHAVYGAQRPKEGV